jgi:hypothetical protein
VQQVRGTVRSVRTHAPTSRRRERGAELPEPMRGDPAAGVDADKSAARAAASTGGPPEAARAALPPNGTVRSRPPPTTVTARPSSMPLLQPAQPETRSPLA